MGPPVTPTAKFLTPDGQVDTASGAITIIVGVITTFIMFLVLVMLVPKCLRLVSNSKSRRVPTEHINIVADSKMAEVEEDSTELQHTSTTLVDARVKSNIPVSG